MKIIRTAFIFCCSFELYAAPFQEFSKKGPGNVSVGDMTNWSVGLIIVLAVFFICMWLVRKLTAGGVTGPGKMRVLGGLSLGVREKVILLDIGNKQLLLGVTPGRIENLHVLEGEDRLIEERTNPSMETGQNFAEKLRQFTHRENQ